MPYVHFIVDSRGFFADVGGFALGAQLVAYYDWAFIYYVDGSVRASTPEGQCFVERKGTCTAFPTSCSTDGTDQIASNWDTLNWTRFHTIVRNCMTWAAVVMLEKTDTLNSD